MQYYVTFTENGDILGFYVNEIHRDKIPEDAIPITVEQWQAYSADVRRYKRCESGNEPCRIKTQQELNCETTTLSPLAKTPDQVQQELQQETLDNLTLAFADLLKNNKRLRAAFQFVRKGGTTMDKVAYNIRLIARAVAIRYNAGETDVRAVLDSYNLPEGDRVLVLEQISVTDPDIPVKV